MSKKRKFEGNSGDQRLPKHTWNFEVDYNDHFESPKQAYEDLLPFLLEISGNLNKSPKDLAIYDPYWCMGKMVSILGELGFDNVINNNRDFYSDIRQRKVPEFDVLVTNPPYSGEHKNKLLDFLSKTGKPFALLLPTYTAAKSYWKDFVLQQSVTCHAPFYVLPPDYYEYLHPEGTGKDLPPFYSSWFVGGFLKEQAVAMQNASSSAKSEVSHSSEGIVQRIKKRYNENPRRALTNLPLGLKRLPFNTLRILNSTDELLRHGFITEKRPNPKARKKLKAKLGGK